MKEDNVNVIAEISAELQRERQKNAELMKRISILEAQIQERSRESPFRDGQDEYQDVDARRFKKFTRQKIERLSNQSENINSTKREIPSQNKYDAKFVSPKETSPAGCLVNWMSMDDNQILLIEKLKDSDAAIDFDDTDDIDGEYEDRFKDDDVKQLDEDTKPAEKIRPNVLQGKNEEPTKSGLESSSSDHRKLPANTTQDMQGNQINFPNERDSKTHEDNLIIKTDSNETSLDVLFPSEEQVLHTISRFTSLHSKPPKVAFCPKEVKRIVESEVLRQRNAQSHTMRKIIVFASLGIRHGCEDMYDLDFNHFRILRKGEPYVSSKNPGEHVLYENLGIRRKIFYRNRQNPTLCPVQILEEEKNMRPSDASCPSCLFLCIKYGGRTRNLPQNEYVRQRMGRNKLKSFGPLICHLAMLVHIRSGSFFFKALGITLLFMAGFPDDLVQRETKYRNLDLLQKYYRTDEDAKGEELFLPHLVTCNIASLDSQHLTGRLTSAKTRGKKHTNANGKSCNVQRSSSQESTPQLTTPPPQFGLSSYNSLQMSNPVIAGSGANASFNQSLFHMFPTQSASTFVPMMYWPPPNAFPPGPYSCTYGYQSFPSSGANYISYRPQAYYSHPSYSTSLPELLLGRTNNNMAMEETDSESDSNSSSSEQKQKLTSCH